MGFISSFSKYIIFLFNLLIVIAAIVLIVFGVIFMVKEDAGVNIFDNSFSLGGLAIGVGAIIFLIAFLGCCGAIRQNICMLTTYAIVLLALFIAQVVLGILAFLQIKNKSEFESEMRTLVKKLFDTDTSLAHSNFDELQQTFECCGVNGKTDYPSNNIPASCCKDQQSSCTEPFKIGCAQAFADTVYGYIEVIAYVAIAFAVVELVGAIFAFMIRSKHKKSRQYA